MDVQRPAMEGRQAIAVMRARDADTRANYCQDGACFAKERARCQEARMDDNIAKPIHIKQLLDMVDASGPPAPKPADAIRALVPPAVSAPAPAAAVCEWETAVARVGGHPEVLKRLVPLLAQRTPGLLTAAHTAIAQHDSPALRQALHTLQGSVGIFVAQAALEAAQRLDALGRQEDWPQAEIAYAHLVREVAQLEHALRAVL